jgi:guanylate kinase
VIDPSLHARRLFVISAPSGAGKTSLVQALLQSDPELCVSVSHTTRPRRPNEVEGRDYFFVNIPEFEALRDAGAFLEWAQVFDNFYGTGREQVEQRLGQGRDVLLEIDWQGARQVRTAAPLCTSIFVLPPSRAALEARLRARRTDSDEVIQRRLRDAAGDMSHCREFDYAVVNDRFEVAVGQLRQIVRGDGESLRSSRPELATLLAQLVA